MVMVGSEVVLALVTLPENDSQQSVVYLSSENRVEIRDETLAEAVNEVVNCRINNGANDMMENVVRRTERTNINRMNAQHLVRCHLHIR
jgi:hypothetical protein